MAASLLSEGEVAITGGVTVAVVATPGVGLAAAAIAGGLASSSLSEFMMSTISMGFP